MAIVVGSGDYEYRISEGWAKLADGWSFKEVAPLGVDPHGDLSVGEPCWTLSPGLFPGKPGPDNLRALQNYERVR
jgi:hypothetical protein